MDITEDNLHAALYHICKAGAPDYVYNSEMLTKEAAASIPDTLFADRTNRRYPIDTKANTWLSAAYFAKTAQDGDFSTKTMKDYVESVIKLAANKYGISRDVDAVFEKFAAKPIEKTAADDESNYGWPSEKKYPMFDERGVKLACSYFDENAFNYPPAMRKEIAGRILSKCAEYSIQPSDRVRTEAGSGFQTPDFVAVQLADRIEAACAKGGNVKLAQSMKDVMSTMLAQPVDQYMQNVEKVASIVDGFDQLLGFDDEYGTRFHSPAEIFYSRDIKEAQDFAADSIDLGGQLFSITKLAGLPFDLFTDALGDRFGDMIRMTPIASSKVTRITKKVPGGMMRITISGGMPELMDDGFGVDDLLENVKCLSNGCDEECTEPCDEECDEECSKGSDKGKNSKEEDVIDVKKLGKALKALPERDLKALRKAIDLYVD